MQLLEPVVDVVLAAPEDLPLSGDAKEEADLGESDLVCGLPVRHS